jgi:glycosyltransferase involved in cell wall biosynthesis
LRPQVIQSQHFYTNIYAGAAGRCLRRSSIGAIRNDAVSELTAHAWPLGWVSVKLPHWVAANSAIALRNLGDLKLCGPRCLHLPNVVDTDHFRPAAYSSPKGEFTILGVGRLEPQKRFDVFLEAASRLSEAGARPVRAIIVGEGSMHRRLEKIASHKRRPGFAVELLGGLSNVLPIYEACHVLLLTSGWEGTPNVVMEAMACGLPVVATNVGGVPDLVRDGETGFVFDVGNVEVAVSALVRLVRNQTLAREMGSRARAFIEANHSVELLPQILAGLYEKVLAKGHQTGRQTNASHASCSNKGGGSADSFVRESADTVSRGQGCPRS